MPISASFKMPFWEVLPFLIIQFAVLVAPIAIILYLGYLALRLVRAQEAKAVATAKLAEAAAGGAHHEQN